jgi:Eukaryotic protein of unknown function (DUF846)
MASHDLHFAVSQNGVEDPNAFHDSPQMPGGMMNNNNPSGNNNSIYGRFAQSSHPIVCIFHLLFKGLALFMYLFGGWFTHKDGKTSGANFITVTVCCMLLLAADFWVVKNITGRLLVGLRWWNKVEGETTKWIFESAENRVVNQFDSTIFWTALYATPLVWGFLFFIGLLKLNLGWLIIVVMALALSCANVYGYYKCSSDQKVRFQQMLQSGAQAGAMSAIRSNMFGYLTGQGQPQQTYV